jgi:aminomethyltransferase
VPRLLLPGLLAPEPGLETYWVRAGGVTGVRLDVGDRLTVVDRQGRQAAEVTVLLPDGSSDGAALGVQLDVPAATVRALVARTDASGVPDQVVAELRARGAAGDTLRAARLFGDWSPAGARESFTAVREAVVLVAAPAHAVRVDDEQANPPSDLLLEVRRAAPLGRREPVLPAPLADPVLDLRVDAATASSYTVKAGQYLQIIDVEGR